MKIGCLLLVFFGVFTHSLFAQLPFPTKGEIFNDSLWILNQSGFHVVDLTGPNPSAPSIYQNSLLDTILAFTKSDSKLWFLATNKIVSYNGKRWKSYPFDTDSLAMPIRFFALSDDTLFYSIEYFRDKNANSPWYAIVVRERAWVNGKSFVYEIPNKPIIYKNKKGTSYEVEPYQIIKRTNNGKSQIILPENPLYKIQNAWPSPDGKLWIYQGKEGLSIIGDSLEKRIPFSFSKSKINYISNLFFLDSIVVAVSPNELAIYNGQQWFFEPIPLSRSIFGYKHFVLLVTQNGFSYKSFAK